MEDKFGRKTGIMVNGYRLYYGRGGNPRSGVRVCLKEEWQDTAIARDRKSDRIMTMKLVVKWNSVKP